MKKIRVLYLRDAAFAGLAALFGGDNSCNASRDGFLAFQFLSCDFVLLATD